MTAFKLAIRNLLGAGLRTWLNVSVLSFAFVVIVFYNGMLEGWNQQARTDTKNWEVGHGQLWHSAYDPFDPFCLQDAHARLDSALQVKINHQQLAPVLITQATIYPEGRMLNLLLKGIAPNQKIVQLPTHLLTPNEKTINAIIGYRMAETARLKQGDIVLARWRDKNGTFDARELRIAGIFHANVPSIDLNQIWISLPDLQAMTSLTNEATLLLAAPTYNGKDCGIWKFKNEQFLLKDLDEIIRAKKGSAFIIYILLLAIALLAIFDTQVLSIFKRQKEIGTYIALWMTRSQVIRIFTIEGSAHSVLALLLASVYGIPFLTYIQKIGIPMPQTAGSFGISIAERIIPYYSLGMVVSTVALVIISATIVSYFPSRKISKLKPTDALKGKIQ